MQYYSTTCAVEDAKFGAAIVTEAAAHISSVLARMVADYGRDLTDSEKLIRMLESVCATDALILIENDHSRPSKSLQDLLIFWGDFPERYDQKTYQIYATIDGAIVCQYVSFVDLLPHGEAVAILQRTQMDADCKYEIACKFDRAMSKLFAPYQGHPRNTSPAVLAARVDTLDLCG